jgi:DNA-directed RNA polymerase subunit RPC12/RpoP
MTQIFISHSRRDEQAKNFFYRAFSGTAVRPIWMEYEGTPSKTIDEEIERKIQASNAVFFLLSETVENTLFTRDWMLWENGKVREKDIWLFEPEESFGKVTVLLPRFRHFVRYQRTKPCRDYVNSIVRSYDDSSALGWAGAGAGIGALLSTEERGGGAIVGGLVGAIAESIRRSKAPPGTHVNCLKCSYSYSVHLPSSTREFRCARCNNRMELISPQRQTITAAQYRMGLR